MFCKHCGKSISDEAIACPNCGHPTQIERPVRKGKIEIEGETPSNPTAISGFVLSTIAFVAGVILLSISLVGNFQSAIYYNSLIILPAIGGLALDIFGLSKARKYGNATQKGLAIAGIVLAAVVLFYFFVLCCIVAHAEDIYIAIDYIPFN